MIQKFEERQQSRNFNVQVPSGLPNLGNTCFLNSILQQLYRIQPIHTSLDLLALKPNSEDEDLAIYLNKLFKSMKKGGSYDQKINMLTQIKSIMQFLTNYQPGNQYDSLQTFLAILSFLFEKDQFIYDEFTIKYSQKCDCYVNQLVFQQITIDNNQQQYCQCGSSIKRKFHRLPNFLIIRCSNQNDYSSKKAITLGTKEYQLQSRNIYIGNGQFGHYFAECYYQGQLYTFDDNFVSLKYEKSAGLCLFAIYKQKLKKGQQKKQENKQKNMNVVKGSDKIQQINRLRILQLIDYSPIKYMQNQNNERQSLIKVFDQMKNKDIIDGQIKDQKKQILPKIQHIHINAKKRYLKNIQLYKYLTGMTSKGNNHNSFIDDVKKAQNTGSRKLNSFGFQSLWNNTDNIRTIARLNYSNDSKVDKFPQNVDFQINNEAVQRLFKKTFAKSIWEYATPSPHSSTSQKVMPPNMRQEMLQTYCLFDKDILQF